MSSPMMDEMMRFSLQMQGEHGADTDRLGAHAKDRYGDTPTADHMKAMHDALYHAEPLPVFVPWPKPGQMPTMLDPDADNDIDLVSGENADLDENGRDL